MLPWDFGFCSTKRKGRSAKPKIPLRIFFNMPVFIMVPSRFICSYIKYITIRSHLKNICYGVKNCGTFCRCSALYYKEKYAGRRKKKVRGDRQWDGRVYAGRNTVAGGYLAFFSVAGTRYLNSYIMRLLKSRE